MKVTKKHKVKVYRKGQSPKHVVKNIVTSDDRALPDVELICTIDEDGNLSDITLNGESGLACDEAIEKLQEKLQKLIEYGRKDN